MLLSKAYTQVVSLRGLFRFSSLLSPSVRTAGTGFYTAQQAVTASAALILPHQTSPLVLTIQAIYMLPLLLLRSMCTTTRS